MPLPSCTPDVNDTTKPNDASYQYCLAAEIRALKTALASVGNPGKNLLINGTMKIAQRLTSATVAGTDVFVCDRWLCQTTGGGSVTVSQASSNVLLNTNYLKATYLSGTVTGVVFKQRIEAKNTKGLHVNGAITCSIKGFQDSGSSQTWTIAIYKPTTGENNYSGGETLIATQNVTIPHNAWTEVSATFSGLVEADTTNGLAVRITSGALTSGKIAAIAEARVVMGSVTSAIVPVSFDEELRACQRYYEKSYDLSVVPGTITEAGVSRYSIGNGDTVGSVSFKVSKFEASSPTITIYNPVTGGSGTARNARSGTNDAVTISSSGQSSFSIADPSASIDDAIRFHWTAQYELV